MNKRDWDSALTQTMLKTVGDLLDGEFIYFLNWRHYGVVDAIGPPPGDEIATTSPRLCELLATCLRHRGMWKGMGYCCVIDGRGLSYNERVGTALHELAHFCCQYRRIADSHGPDFAQFAMLLQRRCPVQVQLSDIADIPWDALKHEERTWV